MAKLIRGSLATIKESCRQPIWEEPNLQYDGTEPPRAWLDRLKQLRQIHGYNDKETVHIAEKCMKGPAQLWFRIHHPKSFDSLRTGLHTRFASGPVLTPAVVAPPRSSPNRLGSVSPPKKLGKLVPNAVQWDVASHCDSTLGTQLELINNNPNVSLSEKHSSSSSSSKSAHKSQGSRTDSNSVATEAQSKSDVTSKSTRKSQGSRVDSNSSATLAQSKSDTVVSQTSSSRKHGSSKAGSTTTSGKGKNLSSKSHSKSFSDVKSRTETQTLASSSTPRESDDRKDKGSKSIDTTSLSLSSMRE